MKAKVVIAISACLVAVAMFCVAQPIGTSPNPATDLATLGAQLHQTQAQLERAVARISVLEEQVLALQKSNAELRQELLTLQTSHLVNMQSNQAPQVPQAPQGFHVVPVQVN